MSHKFTLEYLKKVPLPVGKAQLNISDPKETFLVARIGRRKRSWYCVKKVRGAGKGAKSIYIGNITLMGLEEARRESRRLAAICDEGKDPTSATSNDIDAITLEKAWELYQRYRMDGLKHSTHKDLNKRWRHLSIFKNKKLFRITGSDLADMIHSGERRYTRVRAAQLFDRIWRMVESQIPRETRFKLPVNPFEVMRSEIIGRFQFREYLEPKETAIIKKVDLGRYLAFLEHHYMSYKSWGIRMHFACFLLSIHTGLRFSEASHLKWYHVDWNTNTIKVERSQSKTKTEHIVFMSPFVKRFMEIQREQVTKRCGESPFVFPKAKDAHRPTVLDCNQFKPIDKLLGYRFTSHANRRTFFCFAIKTCRIDFVSAQKMMNHKTKGNSVAEKHYALLEEYEPDGLAKEFALLSKRLCEERDTYFENQDASDPIRPTDLAVI